jgi:hypothetical protein
MLEADSRIDLLVTVPATGRVEGVLSTTDHLLTDQLRRAIQRLHFFPATVRGEPVSTSIFS